MANENGIYATADNFGDVNSDMYEKRPWIESLAVPESFKRKYPSKHYVYQVVVKWSNGKKTTIYRRYSLFFDFMVKLQELVSKLSKFNQKFDETSVQLPELPSKSLFSRSQTHQVAEKRRRKIEEFCQQLILLPPEISESGLVLGFFNVWSDDTMLRDHSPGPEHVISAPILVPNSNGIPLPPLLSPDSDSFLPAANGGTQETKKRSSSLSDNVVESIISHPDEMESLDQYRVLGSYERKDSHQVDLIQGQVVHVIEKHDTGWWMVMSDNEQGYAPAAYLEPLDKNTADNDVQTTTDEVYEAMESYIPVSEDEVGFQAQDRIKVVAKSMDGWWKIRCNGKTGFAPAALIRRVRADKNHQNGVSSERAIYEELNIHHPPPRRNTLDQSVIRRVPPGYASPRDFPEETNVLKENIYCDPAGEGPEDENQIYKVPRLSSDPINTPDKPLDGPNRRASGSSSGEESGRGGHKKVTRMGSHGSIGARRGSRNSHGSRSASSSVSPPPIEEAKQTIPVLKKPPVRPKPPTKPKPNTKPKNTPDPKPDSDSEILENDVYVEMEGSDPMRKASCKRTQSENPYMNSVEGPGPSYDLNKRSASVPTVSFTPKHGVDDYEDLDRVVEQSETPPLPALDDYVDMSGSSPLEDLKKSGELARTNSNGIVVPAPPPRVKPGTPVKNKVSPVSKTFSIDPELPDVFEEECYIDMDAEKSEQRAASVSSPPPRVQPTKPRSASKPAPPPPYSQSPLAKRGLVRAKSMEDILSSAKEDFVDGSPSKGSPPLPKRNFAPPLPARNPPTERPSEKPGDKDPSFLPLKPRAGKTRNPFKRNKNQPDPSEAPLLPRTKPNPERSISPIARHCISPPGIREKPHLPLAHTNSEPDNDQAVKKATYVAVFSFSADSERCLSFSSGDKCELVRRNEETGWWLVKIAGKIGWTPGDFWRESRERSVSNAPTPNAPPPIIRKPRSHTVAEINTGHEVPSNLDSPQDTNGKGSLSTSVEGELSDSGRFQAGKNRGPPNKSKPIPESGSPVTPRKTKPLPPMKYNSSGSINTSQSPPPLPPANATRRLGSHSSAQDISGGPVSPKQVDDYVMLNQVSTSSIEDAQWFAGKMERNQADSFLMEHARQREFLVRERTTRDGYYALSVRYHYNIRHFNIDPTPDGQFCMGTLVFPSIEEIIKHYKTNSLFIQGNQHVTLSQAVKKRSKDSQRSHK